MEHIMKTKFLSKKNYYRDHWIAFASCPLIVLWENPNPTSGFPTLNPETCLLKTCYAKRILRQEEMMETLPKSNMQLMKIVERPLAKSFKGNACSRQCFNPYNFDGTTVFDEQ
ncbi:hypothetical protein TNCV_393941 [Trichonephila clavipes]|nr:hypothetical protein TNCV_393941 [Trichonephila clavipes]